MKPESYKELTDADVVKLLYRINMNIEKIPGLTNAQNQPHVYHDDDDDDDDIDFGATQSMIDSSMTTLF